MVFFQVENCSVKLKIVRKTYIKYVVLSQLTETNIPFGFMSEIQQVSIPFDEKNPIL